MTPPRFRAPDLLGGGPKPPRDRHLRGPLRRRRSPHRPAIHTPVPHRRTHAPTPPDPRPHQLLRQAHGVPRPAPQRDGPPVGRRHGCPDEGGRHPHIHRNRRTMTSAPMRRRRSPHSPPPHGGHALSTRQHRQHGPQQHGVQLEGVLLASKAAQTRNPPGRRFDLGVQMSRLRDSNPRPTHYEGPQDHPEWCWTVPPNPVSPDQRLATLIGVTPSPACATPVRSRSAHAVGVRATWPTRSLSAEQQPQQQAAWLAPDSYPAEVPRTRVD